MYVVVCSVTFSIVLYLISMGGNNTGTMAFSLQHYFPYVDVGCRTP